MIELKIENTEFGSIEIDGKKYDHDVVVLPDRIVRREKQISKDKHGTSHKFSREEMEKYLEEMDAETIEGVIIGTGQYGRLGLLHETKDLLNSKKVKFVELKTPDAIERFNIGEKSGEKKIGIFHVTC